MFEAVSGRLEATNQESVAGPCFGSWDWGFCLLLLPHPPFSWHVHHLPTCLTVLANSPVCRGLQSSSASCVKTEGCFQSQNLELWGLADVPQSGSRVLTRGMEPACWVRGQRGIRVLHQMLQLFHHAVPTVTMRLEQPQLETDATGRKGLVALGVKWALQEGRWEGKLKTMSWSTDFKLPAICYLRPSHVFKDEFKGLSLSPSQSKW